MIGEEEYQTWRDEIEGLPLCITKYYQNSTFIDVCSPRDVLPIDRFQHKGTWYKFVSGPYETLYDYEFDYQKNNKVRLLYAEE